MEIEVRTVRAEEWPALRAFRLQALRDDAAPVAFVRTHDEEAAEPDSFWIDRAANVARGETATQVVGVADGAFAGTVIGLLEEPGSVDWAGVPIERRQVLLVGVYVAPEARGSGLLGRLVDAVADWARGLGVDRLRLQVHAENPRAEAAYRKLGFELTGASVAIPVGVEREMVRGL
ncbi:MAG TPA: GNAT family N-acetyltransferase [Nocardioides sp.]|nr:GNAT family N-acetyltransferase [Nocardioides sp.]